MERGVVLHASGRRATFGELARKAAALKPPAHVTLKDPKDFTLVGKPLSRLDGAAKTDGSAKFTMDLALPGMLTALIARPPRFGATVKSFDPTAAQSVKGVTHVVRVPLRHRGRRHRILGRPQGEKGREALRVSWDESRAETRGSDDLYAAYRALAGRPGRSARRHGDTAAALRGAAKVIEEAVYEFPYLAHAPMEPLDAVIRVGPNGCDVWTGSQLPTADKLAVARVLRMLPTRVRIHTTLAGGSFGRRATPGRPARSSAKRRPSPRPSGATSP